MTRPFAVASLAAAVLAALTAAAQAAKPGTRASDLPATEPPVADPPAADPLRAEPLAAEEAAKDLPGWGPRGVALLPDTRTRVLREADIALRRSARPVERLGSAGSDDKDDERLEESRAGFVDADDAVLLALAWRATGDGRYRGGALERLRAWAETNEPTGHPIDETRLDALVNAYTLLRPTLAAEDDEAIRAWLDTMRAKKRAWPFGRTSTVNNHRTHQIKMLLLLDRALGDDAALAEDRAAAEAHAAVNLDAATGESVDLHERDALYYHAYNLDAWLEIVLATRCCEAPVHAAWELLEGRLHEGRTTGEFAGSTVPLDARRGRAGFGYGSPGSTFDPVRAEHAILTFHTVEPTRPNPFAARITAEQVERRNLYALARYESWPR